MKQIICLIAVFFLLAGAKTQNVATPNTSPEGKKAVASTTTRQAVATAPAAQPTGPAPTGMGVPDPALLGTLANMGNMPDKATMDLLANPAFMSLMSGAPEEVKARLDALTTAAMAAPMVQEGMLPPSMPAEADRKDQR